MITNKKLIEDLFEDFLNCKPTDLCIAAPAIFFYENSEKNPVKGFDMRRKIDHYWFNILSVVKYI